MKEAFITEITIENSGRLLVRTEPAFEYVYRAAMGVHWDEEARSMVTPKPEELTYVDWFRKIAEAVADEYKRRLRLTDNTTWTNVPAELRVSIQELLE